jgi:glycosyltransferase involved in cell wall biosynthesis
VSAAVPPSSVTVVVTTRNRRDDLEACLDSVVRQSRTVEAIVIDDASDDGTGEMVRRRFPGVVLVRHDRPRGYIVGRNEAARLATGAVIISLDDDAVFSASGIVAETLEAFSDERIGAVAIPYADVKRGPQVRQRAPDRSEIYVVNTFIGTAHAVRREVFLALGGYREHLFHQGEESDFCIRLLAAGFVVRLGYGDPIHHFESPNRDVVRMDRYGPRNALLFCYQNVPWPAVAWRLPATLAGLLAWTREPARQLTRLRGIAAGFGAMSRNHRHPVPSPVYSLWRRLQLAQPPLTLAQIRARLAPWSA